MWSTSIEEITADKIRVRVRLCEEHACGIHEIVIK